MYWKLFPRCPRSVLSIRRNMLQWTDFNFSRAVFLLVSCCALTCVHRTRVLTNIARSLHVMAGTPGAGNGLICMCMNFRLAAVFLWCICCNCCLQRVKADEGHGKRGYPEAAWLSTGPSGGGCSAEIQQWLLQKGTALSRLLISTSSLAEVPVSHSIN